MTQSVLCSPPRNISICDRTEIADRKRRTFVPAQNGWVAIGATANPILRVFVLQVLSAVMQPKEAFDLGSDAHILYPIRVKASVEGNIPG
ncbi:hypothetical protein [Candidatus Igneacidithiobacillus taiwanensis]|uniref:hypothetical protein n=1 Tax=Candidatus Igneacidithiobacillus taiwanensis TaxID=1945924 RepID=UPI00289F8EEA|nr:hypothetical protein [Candidatus Igneacidithiobacillus taiwanensis]